MHRVRGEGRGRPKTFGRVAQKTQVPRLGLPWPFQRRGFGFVLVVLVVWAVQVDEVVHVVLVS